MANQKQGTTTKPVRPRLFLGVMLLLPVGNVLLWCWLKTLSEPLQAGLFPYLVLFPMPWVALWLAYLGIDKVVRLLVEGLCFLQQQVAFPPQKTGKTVLPEGGQENRARIQRVSRRMGSFLWLLLITLPLADVIFWCSVNKLPVYLQQELLPNFVVFPLPLSALLFGCLVDMLPTGMAMYGVSCLQRLFRLYEQGQIFSSANVFCYKRLSRVLLWFFAAGIACRTLRSVVLTLHNPPGKRIFTVDLSSTDLNILFLGGMIAIIAWIMEEGRSLQEEHDLTV